MTLAKRSTVYSGTLSNVESRMIDDLPILVGDLTKTIKGEVIVTTVVAGGDSVEAVRDMFVDGANVRFYGVRSTADLAEGENPNRFVVVGPDLTKRSLLKAEAAAAAKLAPKARRVRTVKGPRTEAQKESWAKFSARFRKKHQPETVAA